MQELPLTGFVGNWKPSSIAFRLLILLLLVAGTLSAGPRRVPPRAQGRTAIDLHSSVLDINNISLWACDNGQLERNHELETGGVTFPRGTTTAVYYGGIIWSGLVRDGTAPTMRMGGQYYHVGTVRGSIVQKGIAEDFNAPGNHLYRIRRDWKTADLTQDAAATLNMSVYDVTPQDIAAIRARYADDWLHWPAQKGAPYYERNGIPGYSPDTSGTIANADEPGLAGADQVIWFVCNDIDSAAVRSLAFNLPAGMETQVTCWAYAGTPGLENVAYERYRLIYKGIRAGTASPSISSMYIGKWVDPDIGYFGDDYAGYDEARTMAFAYNSAGSDAEFQKFNIIPPAIGYDLLQGPVVPFTGATARWDIRIRAGYRNLPATSGIILTGSYFESDSSTYGYEPTGQWNNLLQGYWPRPTLTKRCFTNPFSGACTKFLIDGDPVAQTGWLDGWQNPAGDRRFMISSGPFGMALGDTQEVVFALVGGQGKDNLDAIRVLRQNDDNAQDFYSRNFVTLDPIPVPPLHIVELDKTLILDWETDTVQTKSVEQYSSHGYRFYGYNIYQFSDTTTTSTSAQFPPFSVFQPRSLTVTADLLRKEPLVNGRHYYYAITSIVHNPDSTLTTPYHESAVRILDATPHMPDPGVVYAYGIGDTITQTADSLKWNDAPVRITVYDPTRLAGGDLAFLFHRPFAKAKPSWDLMDVPTADTLVRSIPVETPPVRVIQRGIYAYVGMPHTGIKRVFQTMYENKPVDDTVFNIPNPQGTYMLLGAGNSQLDTITGGTTNDDAVEWRFQGDSSWALFTNIDGVLLCRWVRVPYTVWHINRRTGVTRQVWSFVSHAETDSVWRPLHLLDRTYNGKTFNEFYPVSIWADSDVYHLDQKWYGGKYYDDIPFRKEELALRTMLFIQANLDKNDARTTVAEVYIADLDNDGKAAPNGTTIRFEKYKYINDGDVKIVHAQAMSTDNYAAAVQAVSQINVFPNPYYGMNTAERSRVQKFVTFSHLPATATIRIFTVTGVLVKTILKNSTSQFETWDLNNENGLPVASGIYLAHMELRDGAGNPLGAKILKLMIVQEQHYFNTR